MKNGSRGMGGEESGGGGICGDWLRVYVALCALRG